MSQFCNLEERELVHLLIGEIIQAKRIATSEEIERIINCVASAPFSNQLMRVPDEHQGRMYLGQTVGTTTDSLTAHLLKRIFVNGQWAPGTTSKQFLTDIRSALGHDSTRLVLYQRRGGYIAGVLSENVTPEHRRGRNALSLLYIVYSVDRGSIITAYQASTVQEISIPGDALWLR